MLDRVIQFVIDFIEIFKFWRIVEQWERGIVLRLGRFVRTVKPGLVLVWPFHIEEVYTEEIFRKVKQLPPQSLTTADGKQVIVSPVVTYRVRNAKKVILQAGGHEECILAAVPATIGKYVMAAVLTDLTTEEFRATVTTAADELAREWGMVVEDVQFANLVSARSYRLFAEQNHV